MTGGGFLAGAISGWASVYNGHTAVFGTVMFLHLVGVVTGGAFAVSFDVDTLRLRRASGAERAGHLARLRAVHRPVLAGLALAVVTGVLMMLADLPHYLRSPLFLTKMGLLALLAANGALFTKAGPHLAAPPLGSWFPLGAMAVLSLLLWSATALAGLALVVA